MPRFHRLGVVGGLVFALTILVSTRAAFADCISLSTPADLDNVRNNLAGEYCVQNDIDMDGFGNFTPIGTKTPWGSSPFTGQFHGGGHSIENLTIHQSDRNGTGLFAAAANGAIIEDLVLVNANVSLDNGIVDGQLWSVGAVVGVANNSTLRRLSVSGAVTEDSAYGFGGGIVGELDDGATLDQSVSAATVVAPFYGGAGGAVGGVLHGILTRTYAVGSVSGGNGCHGGLVASNTGTVLQSFTAQSVTVSGPEYACLGGLVGSNEGTISQSYSAAMLPDDGSASSVTGALVGDNGGTEGKLSIIDQSYAVGYVRVNGGYAGGFAGDSEYAQTTNSYFDVDTTGQSRAGQCINECNLATAMTTEQLQAALPPGFDPNVWAITPGQSYPYLIGVGDDLVQVPLSIQVLPVTDPRRGMTRKPSAPTSWLYVFLPVGQLDAAQYNHPRAMKLAGLATVYTAISRSIGSTRGVAALQGVKIDTYFWNGKTKITTWQGPVTQFASMGDLVDLPPSQAMDDSNVVGNLKQRQVVILRATSGTSTHWLLATSYTIRFGRPFRIVALDPWSGRQVLINPTTKKIVAPKHLGAVLRTLVVDAYQPVTLN